MTISCPECTKDINTDDKDQVTAVVKRGKCPHCKTKVDIDTDFMSLLKPGLPFIYLLIVNFIVFMILQKGFVVFHIINVSIVIFVLLQKFKVRERELLAKGLRKKK